MSIVDKIVAAVTPPESDEQRHEARQRATEAARESEWLAMILDHHLQIENAFARAEQADGAAARTAAFKDLAEILTAHVLAEEACIYPHLAMHDQKGHATMAYTEQSSATMEMGMLEFVDPESVDWLEKLEHIKGAVQHHMYEEEGTWFPELVHGAPADHNMKMAQRYREEFDRYMSGGKSRGPNDRMTIDEGGTIDRRTDGGFPPSAGL